MTENLKKFFELLSQQDEETRKNAAKLEKDALITFAAAAGAV